VRTATTAQEAMLASVGSDPYERIEDLRQAGKRKAQAEGVVYEMEHHRKILLSRIASELAVAHAAKNMSEAKLERMALGDPRYEAHIKGTAAAVEEKELAVSEYYAIKSMLEWDGHVLFHANALARLER
jgi:hypothetical protein